MDKAMKAVLDVSLLFGQERDLDRLLQVVAEKAVEITSADRGSVVLGEGTSLLTKAAVGMTEEGDRISRTIALEVLRTGEPRMWSDVLDDSRTARSESIMQLEIRSAMCAPLAVGGKVHGVLYVDARRPQLAYTQTDLLLFQVLANHAAMAIENAQLIDTLTGLYSATVFYQRMTAEIERYHRRGSPVSLILADLNGLKQINDRHGHLGGNRALVRLARLIRRHIRDRDIPCRYGGDEMAVILPGADGDVAGVVLERLVAMSDAVPTDEVPGWQGAAFGVASCPVDGKTVEAIMAQADARSYQAKQAHYAASEKRD